MRVVAIIQIRQFPFKHCTRHRVAIVNYVICLFLYVEVLAVSQALHNQLMPLGAPVDVLDVI